MRPLVGVSCHPGEITVNNTERPIYFNPRTYVHAVERAGGVPILIPLLDDLSGLRTMLPRLDGLLLPGGIDIEPHRYQEEPHPELGETNSRLDDLEMALARWAVEQNVPTLGICRGMQSINVALGGSLYQDLAAQYPESLKHDNWDRPRNLLAHSINVEPGSLMGEILGEREVLTNSLHHQAVKVPGDGVHISGYAEDGVAELLEVPGHRFMIAVQCHPEELYREHAVWARLFHALIDACSTEPATSILVGELKQPVGASSV